MTRSTILVVVSFFNINTSLAAMPESLYQEALRAAQNKVHRLNENKAGALSSSAVKALFGRYYRIGDSWDVAAWQLNHPLTPLKRSSDGQGLLDSEVGVGGLFHYEVVNLKNGAVPSITVQITQKGAQGFPVVDPRVTQLNLVFSDVFVQGEKTYFFQGNNQSLRQGVRVFPDGIRSKFSPLELFPLDVPDVVSAEHKALTRIPLLPERVRVQIREFSKKSEFNPDLERSTWFEQDDFFGRPVQVLWQKGDPWPSYIKTSGGISILLHGGNL